MSLENFQSTHKLLFSYKYTWAPIEKGYNNRTLYVNVGTGEIKERPVSAQMKEKFTGGKGFGLKLLWDATKPTTRWNDPENEIVINTGPICGITQYSGTGKSLVVTISPQTDIPVDSNVGGFFGPFMKFAGFDSLELQGKSDKDVIVFIDETRELIEIYEAGNESADSHLMAE
jgi:aldehyde:ferredoxin oxidoreductase